MSRGTIGGQRTPAPMELGRKRSNIIRTLPVKAGESVAAGDVVDVIGGAVGKGFTLLPNKKTTFSTNARSCISICKLTDDLSIICSYYGYLGIADPCVMVDGTPTFPDSSNTFSNNDTLSRTTCARLSDTQFVVGYIGGGYFYYKIGSIRGTVISFGDYVNVCSPSVTDGTVIPLAASTILSIYNQSGLKARVNSGTVASLSGSSSASYISACRLPDSGSNKRVCVCYRDNSDGSKGKAVIATISSSNVVTWGTPVVFAADSPFHIDCTPDGADVVVGYSSNSDGYIPKIQLLSITGSLVVPKQAVKIDAIGGYIQVELLGDRIVYINGRSGLAYSIKRDGDLFIRGDAFVFNKGEALYGAVSALNDNDVIIAFADGGNSNYGTATLLEVRDNQIAGGFEESSSEAIALQSGSGGQNIDILYDGVAELPGITVGTSIESPGVRGYAPMDGVLWVGPEWDATRASGTYVGTGTSGKYNSNTLEFEFPPTIVVINGNGNTAIAIRGSSYMAVIMNGLVMGNEVTWGENGISWYNGSISGGIDYQLNKAGIQYSYVAL